MSNTDIDPIEQAYNENIAMMYQEIKAAIVQSNHEHKESLIEFMNTNAMDVKVFFHYLMSTYSVLAFVDTNTNSQQAQVDVKKLKMELKQKMSQFVPLKEFAAIVYQMVRIEDINPNLTTMQKEHQQCTLEHLLFT